ncbi:PREDICTED: transcription factor bHLH110-like isoform X2 [Populus euphratica]|uniref:Transcription factor bHLH110-like isoform X2 n=1 Tax=Populus euphratica TaxID=75702 RepID=A0AAJ6VI24_POPEU|nr:PREDICTED: transcription factor bHLH110-like isoform X2 [Populus euphratica]
MESANLHHQHQLQDQFVGSSSLTTATPSSYAEAGSAHAWTQTITLNSDISNPSYNGVIFNQRQKNESPISSFNSTMFQDLGFHYWNNNAGNFSSHSAYDLQLSKIKEGLSSSDSFPKFTEMLNSPSSTIEDPHVSSLSYIKDELKDLSLSVLETISSGFPINGHDQFSPREISSSHHNCSSFGSATPSRGSFSQIYPSINISNLNQPSSPLISGSFNMNSQALDLLTSTRFSGSFPLPASLDPLDMFKDSLSFGLDSIQQSNQRPSRSPRKISSTNEITEAKRPNNSMMEATQAAAPKKSRLESRSPCPPFKVRKEKLGDRIAALQQLVAPFGKTDTASVLLEAIGYIKFLQNQVEASNSGGEESKRDLRSRGLCLVPLSCMSYVTTDGGGGGIWPLPNFGGGT